MGLHNLLLTGLLLIEMLVLARDANTLAFPMSSRWPTSCVIMIRQWTRFGPSGAQWAVLRECRVGQYNVQSVGSLPIKMVALACDANALMLLMSSCRPTAARNVC